MDHQKQYGLADEFMFHQSHQAEMKLRRMAVDSALSRERPVQFPVMSSLMFHQNGVDPLRPPERSSYRWIVVDLAPGITDHDMRVLVAERIIRPQLRAAGWKV